MIFDSKLRELMQTARSSSQYYLNLYKDIPNQVNDLSELPISDPAELWKFRPHQIPPDGIILKDQKAPKNGCYSIYSKQEWNLMVRIFARGLAAGTLKRGDRVANLFDAAHLNGDFLLLSESLHHSTLEVLHLPITGAVQDAEILAHLGRFEINVLAGPLSTLRRLASYCSRMSASDTKIGCKVDQILFGAECLDQKTFTTLAKLFPRAQIRSIGFVMPRIGLIGYSDWSCSPHEFRIFSEATWIELIDPTTKKPIQEVGKPGKVITTQLFRSCTPIIRYPTGEWAEWVETAQVHDRKLRRLGGFELENRPRRRYPSTERSQSGLRFLREAERSVEK
jgi:phenylacetate-CoA ligase